MLMCIYISFRIDCLLNIYLDGNVRQYRTRFYISKNLRNGSKYLELLIKAAIKAVVPNQKEK